MHRPRAGWLCAAGVLTACAGGATPPSPPAPAGGALAPFDSTAPGLPPVPAVEGPLRLSIVYPSWRDVVDASDSSFIFGSLGTGRSTLTINGFPVKVQPNGAWLAWLPLPRDTVARFDIVARTDSDSVVTTYLARRTRRFEPPLAPVWIDSLSVVPRGRVWWPADEYLPVSLRATAGAEVRIRFPDGRTIPLRADPRPEDVPWGIRAFDRDTTNLQRPLQVDRYAGVIRGVSLGPSPGPVLGPLDTLMLPDSAMQAALAARCTTTVVATSPARKGSAPPRIEPPPADCPPVVEAILGTDTARAVWPVRLATLDTVPVVAILDDDTAGRGDTDSLTVGRARPGGTYHWFLPTGTRVNVSGRMGNDLRVRLSRTSEAWIPAADAHPLPAGTPAVRATVGSVSLVPSEDRLTLRVPLSQRVPFRVEEDEGQLTLRLYGTVGDIDWIRYGGTDPYVERIGWLQASMDEVTIRIELTGPVWGYRTTWRQNDLIFEIRRPPEIDPDAPLKGRLIVVDPGHPPLGATGPTGLREQDANLAVALQLRDLLEAAGARVVMTRSTDVSLDLFPRVKLADTVNADLLVSIHNNALPDGVNPFTNNGTSVYYNQPRSEPLARAVQRGLVHWLRLRDLGIGRGDLALVRSTWMPSVLTEGLFMMLPDQEAALRQSAGQRQYARGVLEGMTAFLKACAARGEVGRLHQR